MLRNFGNYFLIILAISLLQNQALSQTTEPDFDLNQFLTTLSGVYVSIDKPSVILSIQVNANDNSIVVIDVSGTLEFLKDIGYISEEEYKQDINIAPLERGFFGELQQFITLKVHPEILCWIKPSCRRTRTLISKLGWIRKQFHYCAKKVLWR